MDEPHDTDATDEMTAAPTAQSSPSAAAPSTAAPASLWRWLRLVLAAAAVIGLFALQEAIFSSPPLSFTVGDTAEEGVLRDWESAPDDQPLSLRFSDGTSVELAPGARARVLALGRMGAHLVIEAGRAHVTALEPRLRVPGEAPWRISLGPFTADASAGQFDIGWDPRTDEVALDVRTGSDRLGLGAVAARQSDAAGEGVRASCAAQEWARVPAAPTPP